MEFYALSPIEFHYALQDFNDLEIAHHKAIYESMRLQTFMLMNIQLPRKDKIKRPEDLMKFGWDGGNAPKEVKKQTVEEMKAVLKGIVQAFKK